MSHLVALSVSSSKKPSSSLYLSHSLFLSLSYKTHPHYKNFKSNSPFIYTSSCQVRFNFEKALLEIESQRLGFQEASTDQLASTWMSTSHTNRVFEGRYINWVFKTWFLCGHYEEKFSTQTWLEHENWASKTWFIGPKSSLLDSRCY